MHGDSFSHGLRLFASRPGGPSRARPPPPPPAGRAAWPAATTSSACGPRAGFCTPGRPGGPPVRCRACAGTRARAPCGPPRPPAPGGVLLAHPGHGGVVDLQRSGDRPVSPARADLTLVGLEQDADAGRRTPPGQSACGAVNAPAPTRRQRAACACSALGLRQPSAVQIRSGHSHSGTPVALCDNRWPGPSREIRYGRANLKWHHPRGAAHVHQQDDRQGRRAG